MLQQGAAAAVVWGVLSSSSQFGKSELRRKNAVQEAAGGEGILCVF